MFKRIKQYFKQKREAEDKAWKDFGDSIKYSYAFFTIAEMVNFHATPFCDKCQHLAGAAWNKETFNKILDVHNIKVEARNE